MSGWYKRKSPRGEMVYFRDGKPISAKVRKSASGYYAYVSDGKAWDHIGHGDNLHAAQAMAAKEQNRRNVEGVYVKR